MRFRAQNLMSFWKAHEFCRLNLMTFTQKPHEFSNSSEIFCPKLMSFTWKAHDFPDSSWLKAHEFSTTSWVLSTPWGLTHVEIMSFICWRSWAFHFGICWNSWAFLGGLWQSAFLLETRASFVGSTSYFNILR